MIKFLEMSGIQHPYLDIVKSICRKPVANTKPNGEKLEGGTQWWNPCLACESLSHCLKEKKVQRPLAFTWTWWGTLSSLTLHLHDIIECHLPRVQQWGGPWHMRMHMNARPPSVHQGSMGEVSGQCWASHPWAWPFSAKLELTVRLLLKTFSPSLFLSCIMKTDFKMYVHKILQHSACVSKWPNKKPTDKGEFIFGLWEIWWLNPHLRHEWI